MGQRRGRGKPARAAGRPAGRAVSLAPEAAALARFALFAGAPAADLERARQRMRLRVVEAGREIIAQGVEDRGEVYLLISGRVEVAMAAPDGASVWIGALGPGDVFGDMEAIEARPRDAEVRALGTCRLAVMTRADFLAVVTEIPDVALRMMRILAARLRRQNRRYVEKSALDLRSRLGAELLRRGRPQDGALVIDPAPGPTEIGRAIGARRETVSRALARLVDAGALRREAGRLVVLDRRALEEPSEGRPPG